MTDVFKTTENSSTNIQKFIDTIEDADLREVFISRWQDITAIGKLENNSENSQQLRSAFFDAIKAVISKKLGDK